MSQSSFEPTPGSQSIVGALSGKRIHLPDVNAAPMPLLAASGVIYNGEPAPSFGTIDSARGYPDVRSFHRKLGLLVPATNTSMEHELWSILGNNQETAGLAGVGIHTANVLTPNPRFGNASELFEYRRQFLGGLKVAVDQILVAQPQYLIMGMSLEHILVGIDEIRTWAKEIEDYGGLSIATWHDAAFAALSKFNARRVGLLTPFERVGNENAKRMFEDLGFDVAATVGFSCGHAMHIAHIPDWAKEKAIMQLLATAENRLDAIIQCGTNMSLIQVSERLEPLLDIPVIGINSTMLWYALRENGFAQPVHGAGILFREF